MISELLTKGEGVLLGGPCVSGSQVLKSSGSIIGCSGDTPSEVLGQLFHEDVLLVELLVEVLEQGGLLVGLTESEEGERHHLADDGVAAEEDVIGLEAYHLGEAGLLVFERSQSLLGEFDDCVALRVVDIISLLLGKAIVALMEGAMSVGLIFCHVFDKRRFNF